MTKLTLFVTPSRLDSIERGMGYENGGKSLADVCAEHSRQLSFVQIDGHLASDLNEILLTKPMQVILELTETPHSVEDAPYGIELAYRLTELGIDVLILASERHFKYTDHMTRILSPFLHVSVVDANHKARRITRFITAGNRYLLESPFLDLMQRQEEAHQVALRSLRSNHQQFLHHQQLAQERLRESS